MASNKKYFRSFEELTNESLTEQLAEKEFAQEIPVEEFLGNDNAMESAKTTRRDFLKFLGFSTAAVTLASCEAPIVKSIPYVVKPDSVTPGIPNYYATSYFDGLDYANVLIKTREGRPIKVEANKSANHFGSTNARVQASVLSLYDSDKIKEPKIDGKSSSWDKVDALVQNKLNTLGGKKAVLLTPSMASPSTKKLIEEFTAKYPTTEHVVYDAYDASPALDAAEEVYGQRVLPYYDLSKAKYILSFNADFLGDYNGGGMDAGYASAKKVGKGMLRHYQVESNLSLTGSNADKRFPVKPSETYKLLSEVYKGLTSGTSNKVASKFVQQLRAAGSNAVVMADGNKDAYVLAYNINALLNSSVVASDKALLIKESNQKKYKKFLLDAASGNVGVLLSYEVNPAYDSDEAHKFESALKKIDLTVALSQKEDETASLMKVLAPVPHWLESWNDYNPVTGMYSLQQPTIQKIFDSRQLQDSLLKWMETPTAEVAVESAAVSDSSIVAAAPAVKEAILPKSVFTQEVPAYYNYLKANWESSILPQSGAGNFNKALYDGVAESTETIALVANASSGAAAASKLSASKSNGTWDLQLYLKTGLGDGRNANNPWLQELPDPITRTSWDNYITMNPLDAEEVMNFNIKHNANTFNGRMQFKGNYVTLEANGVKESNGVKIEKVPVFIQVGQARGTIGLALGYGRTKAGKVANGKGINAYPLFKDGNLTLTNVSLTKESGMHEFACMQMQNTLMGRYEIARDATLEQVLNEPIHKWNEPAVMPTWTGTTPVDDVDLWRSFDRTDGPHFNLSVDLNSCTGCGACVVACQAENNVPVVGKEEMRMSRDMYWLRIDRYYSDSLQDERGKKYTQEEALKDENHNEPSQYRELIKPAAENPTVTFQPMMCQHCNHAPCETVCPVAATSHGKQGQNMMAYNRCVGTRYCANNCPYKVRRFNWLNYAHNERFAEVNTPMNDDLGRMVLNPDVAVRTRGVMEKCSMCIQMTQATILKAKQEGRRVKDDEFQTACSNACVTGSIKFGDINDKDSEVSHLIETDNRKYKVLEEIGTKPNVFYHVKVRNV